MTLSWPDVDSLGLLPSDVCLFDVLSQPVKVPPPILPIKIPCKNYLEEIFDDCSLPSHWGFSIKNPTIESEVSWSSLLSFLHFRRTEFTTVDMWSKWVEAFPTSKQDSAAVAKALLTEIVPRWGIPRKISSDNGRHFVNDAIKQVGQFLGIDMRTHCSYAPSSGGAVERQNQTIKNKLAKCCEETGLTWLKALPIVLMYMRMRKRVKTNLSPFEILFGRPPFMGIEGGKQGLPSTDVCENDMLNYCKEMSCLLSNISVQVKAAQGKVAETFLHEVRPGDFVVIRDLGGHRNQQNR